MSSSTVRNPFIAASATILFMHLVAAIGCGMCANYIITESSSPNGKLKAVVFQRDCGATTGFSTQVSILKSSNSLSNSSGNVFTSDCDHGKAESGPGGGPTVTVRWLSDNLLEISYDKNARTFNQSNTIGPVKIIYKQIKISAPNHSINTAAFGGSDQIACGYLAGYVGR